MKVEITNAAKQLVTLADESIVRKIVDEMAEEDILENIRIAMYALECNDVHILDASAEITKNCRVWERLGEGSKDYDVWISATVDAGYNGIYKIGIYITDIWQISPDNHKEIANHMFVRHYVET